MSASLALQEAGQRDPAALARYAIFKSSTVVNFACGPLQQYLMLSI